MSIPHNCVGNPCMICHPNARVLGTSVFEPWREAMPAPATCPDCAKKDREIARLAKELATEKLVSIKEAEFVKVNADLMREIAELRGRVETAESGLDRDPTIQLLEKHLAEADAERTAIRAWLCDNGFDAKYAAECDVPGCPKLWQEEVDALTARLAAVEAVMLNTLHAHTCPVGLAMGPCNCIVGELQAALLPAPVEPPAPKAPECVPECKRDDCPAVTGHDAPKAPPKCEHRWGIDVSARVEVCHKCETRLVTAIVQPDCAPEAGK